MVWEFLQDSISSFDTLLVLLQLVLSLPNVSDTSFVKGRCSSREAL